MAEKPKAGRRRSYSEAELGLAIDAATAQTGEASAAAVLRQLVDRFDVSPAINQRSLATGIADLLADREQAAETARIERLPGFVSEDISRMLEDMHRQLLGGAGRLMDRLEDPARELRDRLAVTERMGREAQREHERQQAETAEREEKLLAKIAEKDEANAETERENAELKAQLAERDRELERRATYEQLLAALRRASAEGQAERKAG